MVLLKLGFILWCVLTFYLSLKIQEILRSITPMPSFERRYWTVGCKVLSSQSVLLQKYHACSNWIHANVDQRKHVKNAVGCPLINHFPISNTYLISNIWWTLLNSRCWWCKQSYSHYLTCPASHSKSSVSSLTQWFPDPLNIWMIAECCFPHVRNKCTEKKLPEIQHHCEGHLVLRLRIHSCPIKH